MILGLFCNNRNLVPKPFAPVTCINLKRYGITKSNIVKHVPIFPTDRSITENAPNYLLCFNDGVSAKKSYEDLNLTFHPYYNPNTTTQFDKIEATLLL